MQRGKKKQAAQVAALADRMSRLEVRQSNCESNVTTVEGARDDDCEWPETEGRGQSAIAKPAPSTVVTSDSCQFVSLLVSTRRLAHAATWAVCPVHSSGRVLPNKKH